MAICPVDGKGCCDDLCYGGSCIQSEHGEGPLFQCDLCGQYHDDEDYLGVCTANSDDYDDYPDLEDRFVAAMTDALPILQEAIDAAVKAVETKHATTPSADQEK